ncbi:hypothetical protein [Geminocystis herdmanii]|uniref:hypothetical protein n=1 Tax=Geminocystis herdmanii TaxID=669359 RepID=UPI00034C1D6C|nr:hypothetical protein [Geminocystis herdmanii]
MNTTVNFNEILKMIDYLSFQEQDDLINILKNKRIEQRRNEIAVNIQKADEEYNNGEVFRGTIDDVIAKLDEL